MTAPDLRDWPSSEPGYRRSEVSAKIGSGDAVWNRVAQDVLHWKVKTASGFVVDSTAPVAVGDRQNIRAYVFGVRIVEPVEVVSVVEETDRVGFAYRTRAGHPVSGEEAFIVDRRGHDVWLTVRSLTRPAAQQPWRALYPILRIAQRVARRRYLHALR